MIFTTAKIKIKMKTQKLLADKLFDCITIGRDDVTTSESYLNLKRTLFKEWLINTLYMRLRLPTKYPRKMLILHGKQGVFKTSFLKNLVYPGEKKQCTHIDFKKPIARDAGVIINIDDEINCIPTKDILSLNNLIRYTNHNFCASSSYLNEWLVDVESTVIPVIDIDPSYIEIPMKQVYDELLTNLK